MVPSNAGKVDLIFCRQERKPNPYLPQLGQVLSPFCWKINQVYPFSLSPLYAQNPFSWLDHPENTQLVDVIGLKRAVRAQLLSCDKALRCLRILENIAVKNAAKDLRHLQEQAQVYRLSLLDCVTKICLFFSRPEPCPVHGTLIGINH